MDGGVVAEGGGHETGGVFGVGIFGDVGGQDDFGGHREIGAGREIGRVKFGGIVGEDERVVWGGPEGAVVYKGSEVLDLSCSVAGLCIDEDVFDGMVVFLEEFGVNKEEPGVGCEFGDGGFGWFAKFAVASGVDDGACGKGVEGSEHERFLGDAFEGNGDRVVAGNGIGHSWDGVCVGRYGKLVDEGGFGEKWVGSEFEQDVAGGKSLEIKCAGWVGSGGEDEIADVIVGIDYGADEWGG